MKVRETQLPGVGSRYNVELGGETEFVIVLHNDGDREVFWNAASDADSDKLFEVSESEARKLAEIFDGTYFEPVEHDIDDVFDESLIRWIQVSDNSPIADQTIADSQVRSETGISIIAIQRNDQTISNPDSEEVIRGGDVLVSVGDEEQYTALERLIK